jgi:hypothetical protein
MQVKNFREYEMDLLTFFCRDAIIRLPKIEIQ